MEKRPFAELGLSAEILRAVDKLGYEEASPIQTAVIPTVLEGRDVVGQSATGSGKTAGFAIPAIERVAPTEKNVQVLILCPTRELAVQVAEEVGKLAIFKKGVHGVPIYGGQSYERQYRALAAGVQIVIGTPGRVMDHMERGTLKLGTLKMVILDEADRMLDMGFRDDIDKILSATPAKRQLLFFSATMPRMIQDLIKRYANDPAWIKVESNTQNAPQVDQVYYEVDRRYKIEALTRLIDLYDFRYGIVFCSTKIMVDDLDEHLHSRGYAVDRLHGDISQAQRDRVMDKFRRRGFEFLIATDVAARGLDVDDLEVVFNFDLPNDAEDYTHRIGRTGRAGKSGKAITFVSGREVYRLQSMVRFARLKIRHDSIPSLDQVDEARLAVFFEKIRGVLEGGKFAKQDAMVDRLLDQGYSTSDICSALMHMLQNGPDKSGPGDGDSAGNSGKAGTNSAKARPEVAAGRVGDNSPHPIPAPPEPPAREDPRSRPAEDDLSLLIPKPAKKPKFDRAGQVGREPGKTTLFFNVGRKHLVTPADIVGKIAGVTRLPGEIVGAIDLRQRHALVDVDSDQVELILKKMAGIRVRGEQLKPALATASDAAAE